MKTYEINFWVNSKYSPKYVISQFKALLPFNGIEITFVEDKGDVAMYKATVTEAHYLYNIGYAKCLLFNDDKP